MASAGEARAVVKRLKSSTKKLEDILVCVRGKPVERAVRDLTFLNRRSAQEVLKCLQSAISNAENNHQLDPDSLYVAGAWTGRATFLKRMRPRARGRAGRILKPYTHLTLVVAPQKQEETTHGTQK